MFMHPTVSCMSCAAIATDMSKQY